LSAKWRRSRKHPKRLGFFPAFKDVGEKGTWASCLGGWRLKNRLYSGRQRVLEAYSERGMREPEPLVDILEERGRIIVVAEFAGFKEDSLRIDVGNHKLTLCAEALNRRYYKSLNLPKRVIPNTIRTKCKNGVLEIQLKKAVQKKMLDKVVD
jgi:HSP20 family molecular chaperone IbpA